MDENSPPKFIFSSESKLNQPQDFIFTPALRPIVVGGSTVGQVTLYDNLSKKVAENFFMAVEEINRRKSVFPITGNGP
ncbi:hypothetical protein [Pseudoruegeria sp. SHC-113]|uniref:hypothetical protein n=1 Tax=Pseudoruegeria sp. SHC-113 TaxID=2855439 RepID=UPI0021BB6DDB|nr:hypothetical protein [Pseudoruegeria sp. SHC-113]MCT8161687.1 hypothetical protein [Pseudoruegeria sp. SHC-113]